MPFPIDEKYITITEKKIGVKFPRGFCLKMMRDNGGVVKTPPDAWHLAPFYDTSNKKRIKRTCNDIVKETASAKKWPDFPDGAVAIGANGSGDQLILLPEDETGKLQEAVYWWDHETGEINKVAERFDELEIA
jgi:hypothetical protein